MRIHNVSVAEQHNGSSVLTPWFIASNAILLSSVILLFMNSISGLWITSSLLLVSAMHICDRNAIYGVSLFLLSAVAILKGMFIIGGGYPIALSGGVVLTAGIICLIVFERLALRVLKAWLLFLVYSMLLLVRIALFA